jgi:hypothetical protein
MRGGCVPASQQVELGRGAAAEGLGALTDLTHERFLSCKLDHMICDELACRAEPLSLGFLSYVRQSGSGPH